MGERGGARGPLHPESLLRCLLSCRLGDRALVRLDKVPQRGIVRFVGESALLGSGELWVGLALERKVGKHDGVVRGKRYFSCAPGHGLIVKAARLQVLQAGLAKDDNAILFSSQPVC